MAEIVRTGRAEIYIEGDGQHTAMAWVKEIGQPEKLIGSPGTNMTLTNAFNAAVATLSGLATGAERHAIIKIQVTVTDGV